jgi:hypothetical protein
MKTTTTEEARKMTRTIAQLLIAAALILGIITPAAADGNIPEPTGTTTTTSAP